MPLKYAYHPGNVSHSSATAVAETMEPVARWFLWMVPPAAEPA